MHEMLSALPIINRWSCPGATRRLGIAALFLLSGVFHPPLNGQVNPSFTDTSLAVSEEGGGAKFWRVPKAGLRQELTGTTGYVLIQNVSDKPLKHPIFYGEYYDTFGRFCFSLILSQGNDSEEQSAIAPDESVTIGSTAVGMFPISEIKEVKLFLLQLSQPEQEEISRWDLPVRAPVTLVGGFKRNLSLTSEIGSSKSGVLDLILANVRVSADGVVTTVDVIHTASSEVEAWFRDFIQQATFYPATNRGQPEEGQALVLVRAVVGEGDFRALVSCPQLSPWVKAYAESTQDKTASLVTDILLGRPTSRKNKLTPTGEILTVDIPPAPVGLLELAYQDTYWSSPAVRLVRDDSMPHHMRREIATSQAQ